MKKILTVIGTRPEAIKLIPLAHALAESGVLQNIICLTGQHTTLLDQMFLGTNLKIDHRFKPCTEDQDLITKFSSILSQFSVVIGNEKPDLIIAQGDTLSALAASLAGFYTKVKVAHVEAGLRTGNLYAPWPEEAHRLLIDRISNYFFAPTIEAKHNLLSEGVDESQIWVVGNTAIDAVRHALETSSKYGETGQRSIVVTLHRRENQGSVLREICSALQSIANKFEDIKILFCVHPNPDVQTVVNESLGHIKNIDILPPMEHRSFIRILSQSAFVITDSGGIQEEITFLGKPALVARDVTERSEVLETGNGILVGTNAENIVKYASLLLEDSATLCKMSQVSFPYGDGYAAQRITRILEQLLQDNMSC